MTTAVTTSTTGIPTTTTTVPVGGTLFDFAEPASVAGWSNVDDTVMGGVSASSASWENGALVFAGEVSLENNGGFTSVVSPTVPGLAAAGTPPGGLPAGSILLTGTGDGRTYTLQLRSGEGARRQWTQPFTMPETADTIELPVGGFIATDFMLDPVAPAPVDLAVVDAVAIYLVDGQAGPFRLEVTSIGIR